MLRRFAVLALTALLLAAGCRRTAPVSTQPDAPEVTPRVAALLGGTTTADLLLRADDATTVQAYRIDGMSQMTKSDGPKIHGFTILSGPVDVPPAAFARVADVLQSDGTYLWDVAKACEFVPGVALRYRRGETTGDVLICFSCDEIEIRDGAGHRGHEDVDPRRADLVAVAKALFPDDPKIQALE